MGEDGFQPAPPYHLVDNESSLIDATDMVFVDAISTGYSRTVDGVNPAPFHGQQGDLRAFGDFINEYLNTYGRWAVTEVPDRRKLRHHPFRRALAGTADRAMASS